MFIFVKPSLDGLWPIVILSQVPPRLWILLAWLTLRFTAHSAEVKAVSLPSGRPQTSSDPLTTRWVWRWTRWSDGLPLNTLRPAIEYDRAKILLKKATADWATPKRYQMPMVRTIKSHNIRSIERNLHGMSPMTTVLPTMRCLSSRPWKSRTIMMLIWGRKK